MLRQSKLIFINTFDERILQLMYHNSYNPKLAVITKRLNSSSRTYVYLAQSDFQQPCNLSKRSDKQLQLKTEKRGDGCILEKLHHLENLTISFLYLLTVESALDFINKVRRSFVFGFT